MLINFSLQREPETTCAWDAWTPSPAVQHPFVINYAGGQTNVFSPCKPLQRRPCPVNN